MPASILPPKLMAAPAALSFQAAHHVAGAARWSTARRWSRQLQQRPTAHAAQWHEAVQRWLLAARGHPPRHRRHLLPHVPPSVHSCTRGSFAGVGKAQGQDGAEDQQGQNDDEGEGVLGAEVAAVGVVKGQGHEQHLVGDDAGVSNGIVQACQLDDPLLLLEAPVQLHCGRSENEGYLVAEGEVVVEGAGEVVEGNQQRCSNESFQALGLCGSVVHHRSLDTTLYYAKYEHRDEIAYALDQLDLLAPSHVAPAMQPEPQQLDDLQRPRTGQLTA